MGGIWTVKDCDVTGRWDLNALDRWTVVIVFVCILKWEMNSQSGDVLAVCTL